MAGGGGISELIECLSIPDTREWKREKEEDMHQIEESEGSTAKGRKRRVQEREEERGTYAHTNPHKQGGASHDDLFLSLS